MRQCIKFIYFRMTLHVSDRLKHVKCHFKINKFDTLAHLLGFTIEIILHFFTSLLDGVHFNGGVT